MLNPGDDLAAAPSEDNAILFLKEGTYTGDILGSGENVLIFGSWDPVEGPKSIIDGNLTFNGGSGRIRGLQVREITTGAQLPKKLANSIIKKVCLVFINNKGFGEILYRKI